MIKPGVSPKLGNRSGVLWLLLHGRGLYVAQLSIREKRPYMRNEKVTLGHFWLVDTFARVVDDMNQT